MTPLLTSIAWLALAFAAAAQARPGEVRTWAELADRDWSPAALELRTVEAARWTYLEAPGFTIAGRSLRGLDSAAQEAEAARRYFTNELQRAVPSRPPVIFMIGDREVWTGLVARAGLRPDGESLQVGREIFVRTTNGLAGGRVGHELAHYFLRPSGDGERLPLWIEEGLALRWGGEAMRLTGLDDGASHLCAVESADDLAPWDDVMSRTEYPESPRAARVFYRQAGELVNGLAARLGERGLAEVAQEAARRDARAALAARGWTDAQFAAWREEALRRSQPAKESP